MKTHSELKLDILRFMAKQPLTYALEPAPDAVAFEAFSYPDLKEVLNDYSTLAPLLLQQLEGASLLVPTFYDRVLLCPYCWAYNICFRDTCPECRSTNIELVQMLHHYRCGFMAPEADFLREGQLCCPKCSHPLLHIGKDYEKTSEVYRCLSCRWSGSEALTTGRCIICDHQFEPDQCIIRDIMVYRLSPQGRTAITATDPEAYLQITPSQESWSSLTGFSPLSSLTAFTNELGKIATRYKSSISVLCLSLDALAPLDSTVRKIQADSFFHAMLEKMRDLLRNTDYLARDDDDRLILVLPETDIAGAELLAKRILKEVRECHFSGSIAKTTLSIGIVEWTPHGKTSAAIVQAQQLSQAAYQAGGDRYQRA